VLHATTESRRAAQKSYKECFGALLRDGPIHFNYQLDTLHFSVPTDLNSFYHGRMFGFKDIDDEVVQGVEDIELNLRHVMIGNTSRQSQQTRIINYAISNPKSGNSDHFGPGFCCCYPRGKFCSRRE
jgi:hypothetical protein